MDRSEYEFYRINDISGRYLPPELLETVLAALPVQGLVETAGMSVRKLPIRSLELGRGPVRILMWSQMHGNESTTTRATLDLLRFLMSDTTRAQELLNRLRIRILPMLNPDGSQDYTRENANKIDLNRDASALTQPESQVLRDCYRDFGPDFCFNLHDQRTIYALGDSPLPATLSFLAPSADPERGLTGSRRRAMQLIAAVCHDLTPVLPGGMGRYDDSFNPDCVGDQFQMDGTPTVLFEAGHFPGDYQREKTRFFAFRALLSALLRIADGSYTDHTPRAYRDIPENAKSLVDIRIKNPDRLNPDYAPGKTLAIQYREVLRDGQIHLVPEWPEAGLTEARFGHREWDATRDGDRAEIAGIPGLMNLIMFGQQG